jgi:hypothetical protein
MKRAQFAAAVLCALVCAVLAVAAIHDGKWIAAGFAALGFVGFAVAAFVTAVRTIPKVRA